MGEHTPTLWGSIDIGWQPWDGAIAIVGPGDIAIAWTPSGGNEAANAAFIVKAVNSHDDLVKALKDVRFIAEDPIGMTERKQIQKICNTALASIKEPT